MSLTLRSERRSRFSKTAQLRRLFGSDPWAHRRKLDAVRRDDGSVSHPIARWRFTNDPGEGAAEGAEACEADIEADIGHASLGLAEQEHRALDPPSLEVPMRRLAENAAEAAAEVRGRDMGHGGHRADVERLGVRTVHRVAGAQQTPVQILGLPTHECNAIRGRRPGHARSEAGEHELHERQSGCVHGRIVMGEIRNADVDLVSTLLDAQVTAVRVVLVGLLADAGNGGRLLGG
jgi:hypothetical protein